MVTDLWCHLTHNSRGAWHIVYTMLLSIISEMLPEIHTMEKFDFLKTIIHFQIQSTFVISKLKGPSETLRDIRTSTYQMCRTEENTNRTTKFHK